MYNQQRSTAINQILRQDVQSMSRTYSGRQVIAGVPKLSSKSGQVRVSWCGDRFKFDELSSVQ